MHQTISIPRSEKMKVGIPYRLEHWFCSIMTEIRLEWRWFVDRSVSCLNTVYSWFWWLNQATEVVKRSLDRCRSRRNDSLTGTHPHSSSVHYECRRLRYLINFMCFWLWNSLEIVFRTGLYHIINIEWEAHRTLKVICAGGSYVQVPFEAFNLSRYPSIRPTGRYDLLYAMLISFILCIW